MTSLERFKAAFTFGGRPETYVKWEEQGLPSDWRKRNFFGEDRTGDVSMLLPLLIECGVNESAIGNMYAAYIC